jgi:4-aminobutyrate aminotransferase/(S)-3-amino-2-methylpropionate transaminase
VVGNARGLGAMIGLEFVKDQKTKEPNGELVSALVQSCAQKGLLVESAGRWGHVIRFLAPLVITDEQLNWGLDTLEKAIQENI